MMQFLETLNPKLKQQLFFGGIFMGVIAGGSLLMALFKTTPSPKKAEEGGERYQLETPAQSVPVQAKWVSEVARHKDDIKQMLETAQAENKVLLSRLEVLEEALKNKVIQEARVGQRTPINSATAPGEEGEALFEAGKVDDGQSAASMAASASSSAPTFSKNPEMKFIHLSLGDVQPSKSADNYVPATTYIRAVLTSGMTVSTAESAAGNPKPVTLRCVDDGRLPRGWRSKLKNAHVNASCYGDISSERAVCRLQQLAWVEEDGTVVERKVEGWIMGPDGREGVRGKVVDRSGQLMQGAFVSGFTAGIADFVRMQATQTSPQGLLGYPKPLTTSEALTGAGGQGVGNALDRLAGHYIKKMENMSPVIQVNGGLVVDLVFKEGFFLTEENTVYQNITPPTGPVQESSKNTSSGEGYKP